MSINISPRQFEEPTLIDTVRDLIHSYHVDPSSLVLEITESLTFADADHTSHKLARLKDVGVQLAIDDFGTGYSSMAYLKSFPIDIIKIDKSFIDRLGSSKEDDAIIKAIIALAQAMRLGVTSEGIETRLQHDTLQELGCHFGQGYLFSRPAPAADITEFLSARYAMVRHPALRVA